MFIGASAFNVNITGWNTSSATNVASMFSAASAWGESYARVDGTSSTDGPPSAWKSLGLTPSAANTWTERSLGGSTKLWRGIASSSDGTKRAASVQDGNIWTSIDSGATWTERSSPFGNFGNFRSITSSSDGTKLAAVVQGGKIWTSIDSGENWVEDQSVGRTKKRHVITSSSDGTKVTAVPYGGKIWTSIDSGENWIEDQSIGSSHNWQSITSSSDGT